MKLSAKQAKEELLTELRKLPIVVGAKAPYKEKWEQALQMGADALALQEPKKPKNVDRDNQLFDCPTCETKIYADDVEQFQYCLTCGQKIDWSEESDN